MNAPAKQGSQHRRSPHKPLPPWVWACGLSLFVAAVSCGPILTGFLHTPEGMVYLGTGECLSDQINYYAKMWPGYQGEWFSLNRYSSEPHPPVLWYPFYAGVGYLARLAAVLYQAFAGTEPPLQVIFPATYHTVRIVLVVALFLSIYGLAGQVFRRPVHRLWTMGFAAFAGGWSQGNAILEAHTLQAAFFMPHFVMGQLLYVWTLWGFLWAVLRPSARLAPFFLCAMGDGAWVGFTPSTFLPFWLSAFCSLQFTGTGKSVSRRACLHPAACSFSPPPCPCSTSSLS